MEDSIEVVFKGIWSEVGGRAVVITVINVQDP
jgi:hypothetical protein